MASNLWKKCDIQSKNVVFLSQGSAYPLVVVVDMEILWTE